MEEEEIVRGAQVIGLVLRLIAVVIGLAVMVTGVWLWRRVA